MALSSSTVWELRTVGLDANGGGFVTGASGTDFSQQTSPQYALTGLTSAGAGNVILTASAAADMVGNVLHMVSGTNFTSGSGADFEITSVSVGVSITVSTNGAGTAICTGVGATGVANIGGSKLTLNDIGSTTSKALTAGHKVWVKSGTYTLGANDIIAPSGTAALPIEIRGYGTTRGDGYLGRSGTPANGPLVTTNFPIFNYGTAFRLGVTGSFVLVEAINIVGTSTSTSIGQLNLGADCVARGCRVVNSSVNSNALGFNCGLRSMLFDSDVSLTGATGGNSAVNINAANTRIAGCRMTVVSSTAYGLALGASAQTIVFCTIYGCGGVGVFQYTTATPANSMVNCTVTGNALDGVDVIASMTSQFLMINCLVTDNGGYGIDDNGSPVVVVNCDLHNNTTANFRNPTTSWIGASNWSPVTSGSADSDYVNANGDNYNLNLSSGAIGAGLFKTSIGAYQRSGSGGGFF